MTEFQNLKILGVVGARSGSKTIPHKNIKPLLGKPLLSWIIEAAKRSQYLTRVVLSTDSPEYAEIGRRYGAETPFLRPKELAEDHVPDFDWLHHAAVWLAENEGWKADVIVRLPPTSPICRTEDVDATIKLLLDDPTADSAYTIMEPAKHPYKMWRIKGDAIEPFLTESFTGIRDAYNKPRQSYPRAYFYIDSSAIRWKTLVENKSMAGDRVRYHVIDEAVDIDTEKDFERAEAILQERAARRAKEIRPDLDIKIKDSLYRNLFDLTGEIAVVTGGMGRLGGEFTKALVGAGSAVAIFDLKDIPSQKIRALQEGGFSVSCHKVDITKKQEVARGFREVVARFGVPTILVNNAGLDASPDASAAVNGPYEDYPEDAWHEVLHSHLTGAHFVSQEFIRHIKTSGKKGSIINISSTYGLVAPDQSVYDFRRENGEEFYKPITYSVAKAGVLNFTRWLAEYCRQSGIPVRVNTLVPGGVYAGQNEIFLKEYSKRTVLGRMAEEHEYNAAILFLASHHASSYMTGSALVIDGGWTAR
ncbi:MAG: SDR family oxidoreductase [Candidatus Sungiibacteriota bacterium]|uniref:SDR family oxidoreductase n=1 Tax=Candidatus Sungiibacteriota bacterium TaxID=2750080 RepID=A0A7T5RJV6_9BACT|nr:MAG: SDR family oxidoreductase [Candidatus Sungbacteria bacterium]